MFLGGNEINKAIVTAVSALFQDHLVINTSIQTSQKFLAQIQNALKNIMELQLRRYLQSFEYLI